MAEYRKMDDVKRRRVMCILHRYCTKPRWPSTPNTLLGARVGSSSLRFNGYTAAEWTNWICS